METLSDSNRAAQQQAYMKSVMPFRGITAPQLRTLCKATFSAHPLEDKEQWLGTIKMLWDDAGYREEKHAAIELLSMPRYRKAWLQPSDLPLLKYLIKDGAWWDFVDPLAINHVGYLLRENRAVMTKHMHRWARENNVWVRRSAILSQLKHKQLTDESLLVHAISHSMQDTDFFARKSIGWALREYSKTNPEFVISYITRHRAQLSGLSKREGLKVLLKQGRVTAVP